MISHKIRPATSSKNEDIWWNIGGFTAQVLVTCYSFMSNRFCDVGGTVDSDRNPNPDSVKCLTLCKLQNTTQECAETWN